MRIRLLAAAAVLTLAATACGEEGAEPAGDSKASDTPTAENTDAGEGAGKGGAVLDEPWLIQLVSTHENEMDTTLIYLRVTPSTGESTSYSVAVDNADGLAGNHHSLVDGTGAWAIPGNHPVDPKKLRVTSLTGSEDLVLDLHDITPVPEAVSFDPSRAGVLRVLGEDDSLTDYDLANEKKTPVNLGRPKPGEEFHWWFSSADGLPLPGGRGDTPDLGVYQPQLTTAGDPEAKVCPDGYGGWMLSYPFTDATGKQWAVCQSIDEGPVLRFMEQVGKKWKQVADADVKIPKGTEIYAAIPAIG